VKFSLPYVPNIHDYISTLSTKQVSAVSDIYFSDTRLNPSNRFAWYDDPDIEDTKWCELLLIQETYGIHAHYVINPSVWNNDVYSGSGMVEFKKILDKVWEKGVRWLTINNPLLLRQPEFRNDIPPFKLKLSINNHISTLEEVQFMHETNSINHVILDRTINRDLDELIRIHRWTSERDITLTLLAQEGCITKCQWKTVCDNMISTFNHHDLHEVNDTQNIHSLNLCTKYYNDRPEAILKSPWLLPSSLVHYRQYIDYIKLAGREKSIDSLRPSFDAYLNYNDDIALGKLVPKCSAKISNYNALELQRFGAGDMWLNCKNKCADCDFCDRIYNKLDGNE
jgi:collagenase-like PrtC family protease